MRAVRDLRNACPEVLALAGTIRAQLPNLTRGRILAILAANTDDPARAAQQLADRHLETIPRPHSCRGSIIEPTSLH